jgi:hypothetical protein
MGKFENGAVVMPVPMVQPFAPIARAMAPAFKAKDPSLMPWIQMPAIGLVVHVGRKPGSVGRPPLFTRTARTGRMGSPA